MATMTATKRMRIVSLSLGMLLILFAQSEVSAREIREEWDSRCEECHSDVDDFARKFLWAIDGQLQGQHHIDDLRLFMGNHYLPKHIFEAFYDMLLAKANSPARFKSECSSCHSSAEEFIRKSIIIRFGELRGVETGMAVPEFLQTHQGLQKADIEFFTRLLTRVIDVMYRPKGDV